jgi:hypothetical protein
MGPQLLTAPPATLTHSPSPPTSHHSSFSPPTSHPPPPPQRHPPPAARSRSMSAGSSTPRTCGRRPTSSSARPLTPTLTLTLTLTLILTLTLTLTLTLALILTLALTPTLTLTRHLRPLDVWQRRRCARRPPEWRGHTTTGPGRSALCICLRRRSTGQSQGDLIQADPDPPAPPLLHASLSIAPAACRPSPTALPITITRCG